MVERLTMTGCPSPGLRAVWGFRNTVGAPKHVRTALRRSNWLGVPKDRRRCCAPVMPSHSLSPVILGSTKGGAYPFGTPSQFGTPQSSPNMFGAPTVFGTPNGTQPR